MTTKITALPAVTGFSISDVFEVESFLTSAFISSKITVENFCNAILIFGAPQLILNDGSGLTLNLNGDGSGNYELSVSGNIEIAGGGGGGMIADGGGNLSLFDATFQGMYLAGGGQVNFDQIPSFTPATYSGAVTTSSLVGKTMTFVNGILVSFA